jgi:D-sedoheptulose 7-phosphate isomerase
VPRVSESARALEEHLEVARSVEPLLPQVEEIAALLVETYRSGGRVYTFGNGGSAADAQHFAEELVGRFARERRALPAQSLSVDASAITCIANDYAYEVVFSRQVEAFARPGDAVVAFSTSGRSANVVAGLRAARAAGARTVLFAGGRGEPAREHADHALVVPSDSTARVQELHVLFLHMVLDRVDAWAAGS